MARPVRLDERSTRPARVVAFAALAAFFGVMLLIVVTSAISDRSTAEPAQTVLAAGTTTSEPKPKPKPKPAPARPVALTAIGAYDPEGDQSENDSEAPFAVDGDRATFWSTERYRNFSKPGVGLLVDLQRPVKVDRVVATTDTPGFTAELMTGSSPTGPFRLFAGSATLTGTTTWRLKGKSAGRYVVVWITSVPGDGEAHISELVVRAQ